MIITLKPNHSHLLSLKLIKLLLGCWLNRAGIQSDFNSSMEECSSMVSIAAFGPGDPGSHPGWFAVSNSSPSFHK